MQDRRGLDKAICSESFGGIQTPSELFLNAGFSGSRRGCLWFACHPICRDSKCNTWRVQIANTLFVTTLKYTRNHHRVSQIIRFQTHMYIIISGTNPCSTFPPFVAHPRPPTRVLLSLRSGQPWAQLKWQKPTKSANRSQRLAVVAWI